MFSVELKSGKRRFDDDGRFDIIAHNWNTPRLYASAMTGAILSTLLAHPLDTLKVHAQVGPRLETRRPLIYAYAYIRTYGIRTLYRGFQPVWSTALFGAILRLIATHQSSYTTHTPLSTNTAFQVSVMTSILAGIMYSRFDMAVTRLQADSAMPLGYRRYYTSVTDCLRRMRYEEGRWVFTRGVSMGWLRFAIHLGALVYGLPKLSNSIGGDNFRSTLLSITLITFVTSFITMPLDAGKVILQTQPMVQPLFPYPKKLFYVLQALLRHSMELALRPFKWEFKARAYLLIERFKHAPRPYYYPQTPRKILKFLRKERGLYRSYNGFWFYFYKNLAISALPWAFTEKVGKKHKI